MSREMKNVIVLKNLYSNLFDEVIFVLKRDIKKTSLKSDKLVCEAKRIVEDYINRNAYIDEHPVTIHTKEKIYEVQRRNSINTILNSALVLSIIMFVLLLMRVW